MNTSTQNSTRTCWNWNEHWMLRFVVEIKNTIKIFIVVCCTCYCISGRVAEYFDEGVWQPYPQADFLWAAGYRETPTMRAVQKIQRRHQEPHEMVRNQRGGPVQRLTQSHLLAYLVSQSSC